VPQGKATCDLLEINKWSPYLAILPRKPPAPINKIGLRMFMVRIL